MDSATRRFLNAADEYLNDVRGRSRLPFDIELVNKIDDATREIRTIDRSDELSPGLRQAVEASEVLAAEVELEPEDAPTPGQVEAEAASGIG